MVNLEKIDHLHLVYHFTVPLKRFPCAVHEPFKKTMQQQLKNED